MRIRTLALFPLFATLTVAATQCKPVAEPPAAHRASDCDPACAKLAALKCPEAQTIVGGDTCAVVCRRSLLERIAPLPTACVASANDVASVRACGVSCAN